jgi:hypothetical protein
MKGRSFILRTVQDTYLRNDHKIIFYNKNFVGSKESNPETIAVLILNETDIFH